MPGKVQKYSSIELCLVHLLGILFLSQDSEESEEDDGLTEEEFRQTEGYRLTMNALDAMFGKPKPNT